MSLTKMELLDDFNLITSEGIVWFEWLLLQMIDLIDYFHIK